MTTMTQTDSDRIVPTARENVAGGKSTGESRWVLCLRCWHQGFASLAPRSRAHPPSLDPLALAETASPGQAEQAAGKPAYPHCNLGPRRPAVSRAS
jgi:hypothetical protein